MIGFIHESCIFIWFGPERSYQLNLSALRWLLLSVFLGPTNLEVFITSKLPIFPHCCIYGPFLHAKHSYTSLSNFIFMGATFYLAPTYSFFFGSFKCSYLDIVDINCSTLRHVKHSRSNCRPIILPLSLVGLLSHGTPQAFRHFNQLFILFVTSFPISPLLCILNPR